MYWVIRNEVIRIFNVRFYVYLARSWTVFNFCCGCRCRRLQFAFFAPLLLSLGLPKNSFLNRVCFLQFLSYNPLLLYWHTVYVVVRCWEGKVFYNLVITSQYFNGFESLGGALQKHLIVFLPLLCVKGRLDGPGGV